MFLSYRQMDLLAWCHLFKTAIKMDYKKYKFVNCYPVTIIFYHFFFFFTSFLTFYILCVSSQVITENIILHKMEKKNEITGLHDWQHFYPVSDVWRQFLSDAIFCDLDLLNDKGQEKCKVNSYLNMFVCY